MQQGAAPRPPFLLTDVDPRGHGPRNQRVSYIRYDPGDLVNDQGVRDMVTAVLFWAASREVEATKK